MAEPTLAEKKDKYDEMYATLHSIAEMQMSLSMDRTRAREAWRKLIPQTDLSVLADVLADVLNEQAYKCRAYKAS
ncbi:hypothetical protein ACQSED_09150 [Salmonella enterica]|uniref:hypothetical protein n=1 Tax=Salmonella enterica TaxID=28901 RepID=UPI003D3217C3